MLLDVRDMLIEGSKPAPPNLLYLRSVEITFRENMINLHIIKVYCEVNAM